LQFSPEIKQIELKGQYFYVPEVDTDKLSNLFKEFYRNKGKEFIPPRVKKYSSIMGIKVEKISILELKSRWASCSVKKPKVNFHWKIMMAPVSVIEYLIVHELTHFKYKRHDANFWNEVDKVIPEYQKHVYWLKQYGASLDL